MWCSSMYLINLKTKTFVWDFNIRNRERRYFKSDNWEEYNIVTLQYSNFWREDINQMDSVTNHI
jgi:hypothetical protein